VGYRGVQKVGFVGGVVGGWLGILFIVVTIFGLQGTYPMEGGRSSSQSTGIDYE
jgi:hypothetical protein